MFELRSPITRSVCAVRPARTCRQEESNLLGCDWHCAPFSSGGANWKRRGLGIQFRLILRGFYQGCFFLRSEFIAPFYPAEEFFASAAGGKCAVGVAVGSTGAGETPVRPTRCGNPRAARGQGSVELGEGCRASTGGEGSTGVVRRPGFLQEIVIAADIRRHLAGVDVQYLIRQVADEMHIVGDEYERALVMFQRLSQRLDRLDVEMRRWFVH